MITPSIFPGGEGRVLITQESEIEGGACPVRGSPGMRVLVTASRDGACGSRHRYICHAHIQRMFGLIFE